MSRRTIGRPVSVEGVGLHLGESCRLTFEPAPSGTGRVFQRLDRPGQPRLVAHADAAVLAERRTQLGSGEDGLHTVEHVLAAIAALEIDDVLIEMDAPEPPILDGSAAPFFEALRAAGIREQAGEHATLRLSRIVTVEDGVAVYHAHPAEGLSLDVMIEFPHPLIGRQRWTGDLTPEVFSRELAHARTFGFTHEVAALQARGLIRGANTGNAVVLDESGVVDAVLRWPDEFVRHKAMDCVGDLALAGARVHARVVAERPSHRGTVMLVREMLRQGELAAA